MTEHHQHPTYHDTSPDGAESSQNQQYFLPASILVAAILIAGSVFYNSNLILGQLKGGAKGGSEQVLDQQGAGQNQEGLNNNVPSAVAEIPEGQGVSALGKDLAKVELVEFSDFQCPFCQRFFEQTYPEIKQKYIDTGKVQFVYRHFPLPSHQNAQKAAEASECAADQGKFFEYHDTLFENMQSDGTGLAIADLKQYAADLGLNTSKFNQCLDNGEKAEIVKSDLSAGQSIGVNGTPTLFVNGIRIIGAQPTSVFEAAIEGALAE